MALEDAVSQAVASLFEGLCRTNHNDIHYSGVNSADGIPRDRLHVIRKEFQDANAMITREVHRLVSRVSSRINQEPHINRIPNELFLMILQEFKPGQPKYSDLDPTTTLFDLLLVCRSWHDTIIQSPLLWRYLDPSMSTQRVELALKRSQPLSIDVEWCELHERLLMTNSFRIRRLDIETDSPMGWKVHRLLQAKTTKLDTLRVEVFSETGHPPPEHFPASFKLSDGAPLKHLDLDGVETSLHSPRLSGLSTLIITGRAVPRSPELLLLALSRLEELELLSVCEIPPWGAERSSLSRVRLPRLKKLVLRESPSYCNGLILAHLDTPACYDVDIFDWDLANQSNPDGTAQDFITEPLDTKIWYPGSTQAAILLGVVGSTCLSSSLHICFTDQNVQVTSRPASENSGYRPSDTGPLPGYVSLDLMRFGVDKLLRLIAAVVSRLPSRPPIKLKVYNYELEPELVSTGLHLWTDSLVSLTVCGANLCRSVLLELGIRTRDLNTGEDWWICGKLESIDLIYGTEAKEDSPRDTQLLLELVRWRWHGQGVYNPSPQPSKFLVRCPTHKFSQMWKWQNAIRYYLPSFRLIDSETYLDGGA